MMLISEMIKQLEELKNEYGDIPVAKWRGDNLFTPVGELLYEEDTELCIETDDGEHYSKTPFISVL